MSEHGVDEGSPDLLRGERPRRLRREPEGWVLEIERVRWVAGALYRPVVVSVRGRERIRHRLEGSALLPKVEALMQREPSPGADGRLLFVLSDGELRERDPEQGAVPEPEHEALVERVRHLESSVGTLQRSLDRLGQLERQLAAAVAQGSRGEGSPRPAPDGARTGAGGAAPPPADARDEAGAPERGASAGPDDPAPADRGSEDAAPEDSRPEPEAAEEGRPEAPSAEEASAESADDTGADGATPTPPILRLPDRERYVEGLEMLLGELFPLEVAEDRPEPSAEWFVAPLWDDADEPVGAILANLEAVVHQAGLLMMLPDEAGEAMLERGEPSEDVRDAASEIFNVQSRCFNDIADNPHVRTRPLRRFDPATDGWVHDARARVDWLDPRNGRTVLISL